MCRAFCNKESSESLVLFNELPGKWPNPPWGGGVPTSKGRGWSWTILKRILRSFEDKAWILFHHQGGTNLKQLFFSAQLNKLGTAKSSAVNRLRLSTLKGTTNTPILFTWEFPRAKTCLRQPRIKFALHRGIRKNFFIFRYHQHQIWWSRNQRPLD